MADLTPYSAAKPFIDLMGAPTWASEEDNERLGAYFLFQAMYDLAPETFAMALRTDDTDPIYLPSPKVIVNTTSHYLLKGLKIQSKKKPINDLLTTFFRREKFISQFHTAKQSGVVRGDYVFHLSANPAKPEGSRLSIRSIDPAMYFPLFHPDDLERRIGVRLVEQQAHPDDENRTIVRILDYWYQDTTLEGLDAEDRVVWTEENLWEMEGWDKPEKAKKIKTIRPPAVLPSPIRAIPVYHFKNIEWQGEPFGRSELLGFERMFAGLNQTVSDQDLALALTGIGLYVTDAGRPIGPSGREVPWEIVPGTVLEVPGATMFKKVDGVTSVQPGIEHMEFLLDQIYRATGTSDVALGNVDSQTAESGIALAIKFLPTQAKIEERDLAGVDNLQHLFFDWCLWHSAYESESIEEEGASIDITIGDKLPLNRAKRIDELNNMMDRKVISRAYYRQEMTALGYQFPAGMEDDILSEEEALAEVMAKRNAGTDPLPTDKLDGSQYTPPGSTGNLSNNKDKPNESAGTEMVTGDTKK